MEITPELQKVMDKIRKILRKADPQSNPNEHEREVAMRMANTLLAQHGLSMEEVDQKPEETFGPLGEINIEVKACRWRAILAGRVAELNGVYVLRTTWRGRKGQKIQFIGRAIRCTVARAMYEYLISSIELEASRSRVASGSQLRGIEYSKQFGNGAALGVGEQVRRILREQEQGLLGDQRVSTSQALVVVGQRKQGIEEGKALAVQNNGGREFRKAATHKFGLTGATAAGLQYGRSVSLQKKLA